MLNFSAFIRTYSLQESKEGEYECVHHGGRGEFQFFQKVKKIGSR